MHGLFVKLHSAKASDDKLKHVLLLHVAWAERCSVLLQLQRPPEVTRAPCSYSQRKRRQQPWREYSRKSY